MDTNEIIAHLRNRILQPESLPPQTARTRMDALNRLAAAMTPPRSFDELEWELPPEARYLGPGLWIDAIKNAIRR